MKPPIKEFRERLENTPKHLGVDRAIYGSVIRYMEEYRDSIQGPTEELTDRDEYLDAIIERRANPNVAPIFDGIDISKRTAADMRVELQVVIDRYAGRVTNAEAVGVIMMACAHVLFEDSESQEVDGAG